MVVSVVAVLLVLVLEPAVESSVVPHAAAMGTTAVRTRVAMDFRMFMGSPVRWVVGDHRAAPTSSGTGRPL